MRDGKRPRLKQQQVFAWKNVTKHLQSTCQPTVKLVQLVCHENEVVDTSKGEILKSSIFYTNMSKENDASQVFE